MADNNKKVEKKEEKDGKEVLIPDSGSQPSPASDPIIEEKKDDKIPEVKTDPSTSGKVDNPFSKSEPNKEGKNRQKKKKKPHHNGKSDGSTKSHNSGELSTSVTPTKIAGYSTTGVNALQTYELAPNANNYIAQRYRDVGSLFRYNSDEYSLNFKSWSRLGKQISGKNIYALDVSRPNVSYNNDTFENEYVQNQQITNSTYSNVIPMYMGHTHPDIMYYNRVLNIGGVVMRANITSASLTTDSNADTINEDIRYADYNNYGVFSLRDITNENPNFAFSSYYPTALVSSFPQDANSITKLYITAAQNAVDQDGDIHDDDGDAWQVERENFGNYNQNIADDEYHSFSVLNKVLWIKQYYNNLSAIKVEEKSQTPLMVLSSEKALATVMNSVSRLKTYMYIMLDAINGAIEAQVTHAARHGSIESTFAAFVMNNSTLKDKYTVAINYLNEAFKGIPIQKDVVDMWNKHKDWSKMKDGNAFSIDNTIIIPTFTLGFDNLYNYTAEGRTETQVVGLLSNGDPIDQGVAFSNANLSGFGAPSGNIQRPLNPAPSNDPRLMMSYRLGIYQPGSFVPHGDWLSLFLQTVMGRVRVSDFIRSGTTTNTTWFDNPRWSNTSGTGDVVANDNIMMNEMIELMNNNSNRPSATSIIEGMEHGNVNTYTLAEGEISGNNTHTYEKFLDITQNHDSGTHADAAWRGDMVISYRTFTAYMQAFIVNMTRNVNMLINWANNLNVIKPFFNLMNQMVKIEGYYTLDIDLPEVQFGAVKSKTEPQYNAERNREIAAPIFKSFINGNEYQFRPMYTNVFTQWTNQDGEEYVNYNSREIHTGWTYIDHYGKSLTRNDGFAIRAIVQTQTSGSISNSVVLFNTDIIMKDFSTNYLYIGSHGGLAYNYSNVGQALYDDSQYHMFIGTQALRFLFVGSPSSQNNRVNVIYNRSLFYNSNDGIYMSYYPSSFDQPFTIINEDIYAYYADIFFLPVLAFRVSYDWASEWPLMRLSSFYSIRTSGDNTENFNQTISQLTYLPGKKVAPYPETSLVGI